MVINLNALKVHANDLMGVKKEKKKTKRRSEKCSQLGVVTRAINYYRSHAIKKWQQQLLLTPCNVYLVVDLCWTPLQATHLLMLPIHCAPLQLPRHAAAGKLKWNLVLISSRDGQSVIGADLWWLDCGWEACLLYQWNNNAREEDESMTGLTKWWSEIVS